jgi:hypothetical protein
VTYNGRLGNKGSRIRIRSRGKAVELITPRTESAPEVTVMMKVTGPQNRLLSNVQRAPVRCPEQNIAGSTFCMPCIAMHTDFV